jgi:hypothetical protein
MQALTGEGEMDGAIGEYDEPLIQKQSEKNKEAQHQL